MSDRIELPAPTDTEMDMSAALSRRRSIRQYSDTSLDLDSVAHALWAAQGATAEGGGRTAPSAHAAHPLRTYLVSTNVSGLEPGIYAYDQQAHALAALAQSSDVARRLWDAALDEQPWLTEEPAIIVLTGDAALMTAHFMEQPPVGQRGERYLYLEAGAAAENVYLAATALGLGTVLVAGFDDDAAHAALDVDDDVRVLALLPLGRPAAD